MRIAIDIGYGFVKAMNENGDTIRFPSVVAFDRSERMRSILKSNGEDYSVSIWPAGELENSKSYLIGDAAMVGGSGIRTWEEKAVENANLEILIATAASLLGNDDEIDLVVGLPLTYYRTQKDELTSLLKKLDVSIIVEGYNRKRVRVNTVYVFPQGAGAYYAACLTINGEVKNPELVNNPVGLIDIGYRTTDILVMSKGKKGLMPREELSGGIDLGMKFAYQIVQNEIEEVVKKPIDLLAIEKAIFWEQSKLLHRGIEYSLSEYEQFANEELANQITAKVKIKWGDEIDNLSAVIIAGGGGEALAPYLKRSFPTMITMERAAFANVEGFLAAQSLARKRIEA
jgi:plasmid segregation protein ParM